MEKKHIVLGVTGGIAAYKSASLIGMLKKQGYEVKVIMTEHATKLISPLTLSTLSGNKVVYDMFELTAVYDTEHISLAKWADLFAIVPATANIIGKVANGIADDMLSTTIMATGAPVLFTPAMNTVMWENAIVQANISYLKKLGYHFVLPQTGHLACGDEGAGKLADLNDILNQINKLLEA